MKYGTLIFMIKKKYKQIGTTRKKLNNETQINKKVKQHSIQLL